MEVSGVEGEKDGSSNQLYTILSLKERREKVHVGDQWEILAGWEGPMSVPCLRCTSFQGTKDEKNYPSIFLSLPFLSFSLSSVMNNNEDELCIYRFFSSESAINPPPQNGG
ncbi:hypothetical protein Ancab_037233 [Ancistrocladus abbreviatus]